MCLFLKRIVKFIFPKITNIYSDTSVRKHGISSGYTPRCSKMHFSTDQKFQVGSCSIQVFSKIWRG